jgi:hypothetical protein
MQSIYFRDENLKHRPEVIEKIAALNVKTVLDVGGSWNSYLGSLITHVFDLHDPNLPNVHWFQGSINSYEGWKPILDYVEINGKFDFVNCTHTLEDLAYPEAALRYLPQVAKSGFIAVPSKYWELERRQIFRGGHHHRWIFDSRDGVLTAWPKINLIEYMIPYNDIQDQIEKNCKKELRMFWEDTIEWKIINDDYLGPTFEDVVNYYHNLIFDN